MSLKDFFEITGGTTLKVIDNVLEQRKSPVFFQPFKSKTDIALRATSIATAPIISAGVIIIAPLASVFFACKSLVALAMKDRKTAKEDIGTAGVLLFLTMVGIVSAVVSALINLIDFVGSIFTTPQKKSPMRHSLDSEGTSRYYVNTSEQYFQNPAFGDSSEVYPSARTSHAANTIFAEPVRRGSQYVDPTRTLDAPDNLFLDDMVFENPGLPGSTRFSMP